MHAKQHWEQIYTSRPSHSVSWFQAHADTSLAFIRATGVALDAAIIDVGGGASTLVDGLLTNAYTHVSVLDISASALRAAQQRLGEKAPWASWIESDITRANLAARSFDIWHDRAVFHFLTRAEDRAAYIHRVRHALKPGGHVIVATFAEDGPEQCSGLPVIRYRPEDLHAQFGTGFALLQHCREAHLTPAGKTQPFVYCRMTAS